MTALPELPEPYNCGGDATIAALLREYGRQCYAAGMELAAQIADDMPCKDPDGPWFNDDMSSAAYSIAAAIRAAK
jgi:hypothetical protein